MNNILINTYVSGMCTSKMAKLEIFQYLRPENGDALKVYIGQKDVYSKELAKEMCFQYFYNGKGGEDLSIMLGNPKDKPGMVIGNTITHLGIGLKQNSELRNKGLSQEHARELINELVEYVYSDR